MDYSQRVKQLERMIIAKKIIVSEDKYVPQKQRLPKNKINSQLLPNPLLQIERSIEIDEKLEKGRAKLYPVYDLKRQMKVPSLKQFVDEVLDPIESKYGSDRFIQVTEKLQTKIPLLKLNTITPLKNITSTTRTDVSTILKTEMYDASISMQQENNLFDQIRDTAKRHLSRLGILQLTSSLPRLPQQQKKTFKKTLDRKNMMKTTTSEVNFKTPQTYEIMNKCKIISKDLGRLQRNYGKKIRQNDRVLSKLTRDLEEAKQNNFLNNELVFL